MPISVATPPRVLGVASALRTLVQRALALEGAAPGEIAIVLAGDAELRELNLRYRGLDRATDVLSFVCDAPPARAASGRGTARHRARRPVSGDIVISLDRVDEQAKRFRASRGRELARLVIHGALHLAGLDHKAPGERRAMRAQEERALRLGAAGVRRLDAALAPARGARPTPPARSRSRPPRFSARGRSAAASATGRRRNR